MHRNCELVQEQLVAAGLAGRVRMLLVAAEPPLRRRTEALGRGAREPIIGLGTDDMRDVLDRRVEFRPQRCDAMMAAG